MTTETGAPGVPLLRSPRSAPYGAAPQVSQALVEGEEVRVEILSASDGEIGRVGDFRADLVLAFDGGSRLREPETARRLRAAFPNASLVGCTSAGSIRGLSIVDELVTVAIGFEDTRVVVRSTKVDGPVQSRRAGAKLAAALPQAELAHVLVISDGLMVNGTALVQGLLSRLPPGVALTGGLAADGGQMRETFVYANGEAGAGTVAAIGLYGRKLRVGYGCMGGWDPFGPERVITRAEANVLYELDQHPALALYERYLGEHAAGLPAAGLLFPLSIRPPGGGPALVRTILGVDPREGSITFAGDMPPGWYARLMHANFDRLVDGAFDAGRGSTEHLGDTPQLALLVSCAGRRWTLKQRTEEELEGAAQALGAVPMVGFYSLGELCPTGVNGCDLHNQTMTITTFCELDT